MICFGFFLYPISEHSYFLKAIRKLYLARTSKNDLFSETYDEKYAKYEVYKKKLPEDVLEEIESHKFPYLNFKDTLKLYIS